MNSLPISGLCTIGHSNHALETFLRLLQEHHIAVVADVRSQPASQYTPHFNSRPLREALRLAGIQYLFLGKELGGRPEDAAAYDSDGRVLYGRVAESPVFRQGIERLKRGMAKYRVAMMCAEEDPAACHRHLLISRVLAEQGVEVQHIRADGRVQSEAEIAQQTRPAGPRQGLLFEELEELEWKSIRSVLPKKAPDSSSEG